MEMVTNQLQKRNPAIKTEEVRPYIQHIRTRNNGKLTGVKISEIVEGVERLWRRDRQLRQLRQVGVTGGTGTRSASSAWRTRR